ncbi:hypothetical protein O1Q79_01153 [Lonepinella sp. MS14434]|uniref:hypothetical protein n=1 Tax=Lonepinella sp. BR2923 TaxID=3434553 RepID=UPI003A5F4D6F
MMKINQLYGCLLMTISISATAVENPIVSNSDIVGEWSCRILYRDLDIESLDTLDFHADGSTVGLGLLSVQKIFTYESHHTGRWSLQNNILSENSTNYRFGRIHSKQTEKRLSEEPLLKEQEQQFFQQLTQNMNNGDSTDFEILDLKENRMLINHIWKNQQRHPGLCVKKVEKNPN